MKNISESPYIIGMPGRYVQGYGILTELGAELSTLGENPYILVDPFIWDQYETTILQSLRDTVPRYQTTLFQGECCHKEIQRVAKHSREQQCDLVVGIGGGKTLDTAKAVSHELRTKVVMVPTTASNDAPTSRLVVVYDEKGVLEEVLSLDANPQLVLVDSQVVAAAPVRFLVAGIGDALTTKFEAEQCAQTSHFNSLQGRQTMTALGLGDLCYRILRRDGLRAKKAVEHQLVTPAVDRVIEANILLSGLGFESGGLSVAHGLTRGLSALPELHSALHGEEVAFGLLVQLVLENRDSSFMEDMVQFYRQIGLPLCLAGLGLKNATDEHYRKVAQRSCSSLQSHVYKLAVPVNEVLLQDAIKMVDCSV